MSAWASPHLLRRRRGWATQQPSGFREQDLSSWLQLSESSRLFLLLALPFQKEERGPRPRGGKGGQLGGKELEALRLAPASGQD